MESECCILSMLTHYASDASLGRTVAPVRPCRNRDFALWRAQRIFNYYYHSMKNISLKNDAPSPTRLLSSDSTLGIRTKPRFIYRQSVAMMPGIGTVDGTAPAPPSAGAWLFCMPSSLLCDTRPRSFGYLGRSWSPSYTSSRHRTCHCSPQVVEGALAAMAPVAFASRSILVCAPASDEVALASRTLQWTVFPPQRMDGGLALFSVEDWCTWESTDMVKNLLGS